MHHPTNNPNSNLGPDFQPMNANRWMMEPPDFSISIVVAMPRPPIDHGGGKGRGIGNNDPDEKENTKDSVEEHDKDDSWERPDKVFGPFFKEQN